MTEKTISACEFLNKLSTDKKAVQFFEKVRWPAGRDCRKKFSCKTSSIMQSSPIPVRAWLYTMYKVGVARKGISSLQLSKEIGVTQKTAWFMPQRIKEACSNHGLKINGIVEIDETHVGGKERNKHVSKRLNAGCGGVGKRAVVGMRERGGKVRAKPVARTDANTLHREIARAAQTGSIIYTDDHRSYIGIQGYKHQAIQHSAKEYVDGMAHTNSIKSVWAVLKRGIVGPYHHVSRKHLHRYVDEFTFRLNEGNVKILLMTRIAALCSMSVGKILSYKCLIQE